MISDLSRRKKSLEDAIDRLGAWMIGFTLVVVVGLSIELYAVIISFLRKPYFSLVDAVGLLFVTVGVGGELAVEFFTHGKEKALRRTNEEIEADADKKIAERDRTIARLRKASANRILTPDEHATVSAGVLPFAGQIYRVTNDDLQDDEQVKFAQYIVNAAQMGNWVLEAAAGPAPISFAASGVVIQATSDPESQEAGEALAIALDRCGHQVHFDTSTPTDWLTLNPSKRTFDNKRVWVRIAVKPNASRDD
ncbi:MAG: hypothetical protein KGN84_10745 [Acidobacteriota bacterium]|nr:hypothetical protein [Acidobacteriota bacterium]